MAARRDTHQPRSKRGVRGCRPRTRKKVNKRGEGWTVEEVIAALRKEGGILRYAAERLGCTRETVARYVRTYPEVAEALEQIEEETLDLAERTLIKGIEAELSTVMEGETCGLTATRTLLRTKGRKRGYVTSNEVTGPGGGPIPVEHAQPVAMPSDVAQQVAQLLAQMGALEQPQREDHAAEGDGSAEEQRG